MLTPDSHSGNWWTCTTFLYSIYVLLNIWCILIPVPAPPLLWPTNENKNKINYNWQLHRRSSLTAEHLSLCTSLISYGACRCICASSIHLLLVVCGQVGAAAGWARCFQLPSLHKAFWLFLRYSKSYSLQWVLGLPRGFLQLVVAGKTPKGSQPGGVRIRSPNHLSYLDVLIFWWCGYFGSPPVAWHKPGLSRYQISTRRLLWPKKFIITISLQYTESVWP